MVKKDYLIPKQTKHCFKNQIKGHVTLALPTPLKCHILFKGYKFIHHQIKSNSTTFQ